MIDICMLFDRAHAAEGWLCCRSIQDHSPLATLYVLCLDDAVLQQARQQHGVIGIALDELEQSFPGLATVRAGRPWAAYTQTCKVFLPTFVFENYNTNALCYVDSDMYFWDSADEIETALGGLSFMAASREDLVRPPQGDFNGGFFACRNDARNRRFFEWWQERTLEWCEWRPGPGGRFTEEGYLNVLTDDPSRFPGAGACPHPGINLARWNAHRHRLAMRDGRITIDEKWPLVCFHYQGFDLEHEAFGLGAMPEDVLYFIHEHYRQRLVATMRR